MTSDRRERRAANVAFQAQVKCAANGLTPVDGANPAQNATSREIEGVRTGVRRRKSSRKRLIAQLDALWSLAVRLRDKKLTGGLCRICNRRPIEVGYHIVPRQSHATRWLMEAGCGSCKPCNLGEMFHRLKYREKHIQIFGREAVERLEALARTITHFSDADLQERIAQMKGQFDRDSR